MGRWHDAAWYVWQLPQNLLGLAFWRLMQRRHGDAVQVLPRPAGDSSVATEPAADSAIEHSAAHPKPAASKRPAAGAVGQNPTPPRPLPTDFTMIHLPLPLFGGVSLGRYLFFGDPNPSADLVAHERGHMIQSRRLGPLYLLVVGVPSVARAMYHRRRHAHWTPEARSEWYHRHWPESAADRHGGVRR